MGIFSKIHRTQRLMVIALGAASTLFVAAAQDPPARAVLDPTEAQQKEFIVSYLNRGMPLGGAGDAFAMLVLKRSSMMIPMIEHKIEEVLDSASPSKLFFDKGVDPTMFVATAASAIAYAGNVDALKASASLEKGTSPTPKVDDIATVATFLASNDSKWIIGELVRGLR